MSFFFLNIVFNRLLIFMQEKCFCTQRIDEDKLFNLFSLYGNIVRIKLLRNKPDHALVQMGDGFQAELAVHFLKVRSMKISQNSLLRYYCLLEINSSP